MNLSMGAYTHTQICKERSLLQPCLNGKRQETNKTPTIPAVDVSEIMVHPYNNLLFAALQKEGSKTLCTDLQSLIEKGGTEQHTQCKTNRKATRDLQV